MYCGATSATCPPPLRLTTQGRISDIILATRSAPEFCNIRSPDGAKRNPGPAFEASSSFPGFAALHPGYKPQTKKEAERRQTCSPTSAPYGRGAHRRQVYAVCANPSASGALACRRSAAALRGANQRPRSSPGALPETRLRNGRYPLPPIPVQRLGRRPVLMPAGLCPEPPERGVYRSARGAPHSLHLREYPRPKASFTERDSSRNVSQ